MHTLMLRSRIMAAASYRHVAKTCYEYLTELFLPELFGIVGLMHQSGVHNLNNTATISDSLVWLNYSVEATPLYGCGSSLRSRFVFCSEFLRKYLLSHSYIFRCNFKKFILCYKFKRLFKAEFSVRYKFQCLIRS
jgi:hypothetical protein